MIEIGLFALTLVGVGVFHRRTLLIALIGLTAMLAYKFAVVGFDGVPGVAGFGRHMGHEWVLLANLALLLTGFELLARHFEQSRIVDLAPRVLPNGWTGGLVLLFLVFLLSGVLDNIAAALLGATLARHIFKGEVTLAYLVAIVASANAGGVGSVLGDTTTTMIWIAGVSPLAVLPGYVAAFVAFLVFAPPAAWTQQRRAPIYRHELAGIVVDWTRVGIAAACLLLTLGVNVLANLFAPELLDEAPLIGIALWVALLVGWIWRKPDLHVLPEALAGTLFLLALVLCASLMPVTALPPASETTTLALGFVSAVFNNIPLTKLAIDQGGYDWAMLTYAVGYGGSMVWFGSSAGVAVSNLFPETKSVWGWLRAGLPVPLGYVAGFAALHVLFGWSPSPGHMH